MFTSFFTSTITFFRVFECRTASLVCFCSHFVYLVNDLLWSMAGRKLAASLWAAPGGCASWSPPPPTTGSSCVNTAWTPARSPKRATSRVPGRSARCPPLTTSVSPSPRSWSCQVGAARFVSSCWLRLGMLTERKSIPFRMSAWEKHILVHLCIRWFGSPYHPKLK